MRNDWILDVLTDLKAFAVANGLGALADQLDDTRLIAAAELASRSSEGETQGHVRVGRSGSSAGGTGRGHRA